MRIWRDTGEALSAALADQAHRDERFDALFGGRMWRRTSDLMRIPPEDRVYRR